jgi:hypothetical protein
MGNIDDGSYLQKLVTDAEQQKRSIIADDSVRRIEVSSNGKETTIKLSVVDGMFHRTLAEYVVAVGAKENRTIAEIAKEIRSRVDGFGKDLDQRSIKECPECYHGIALSSSLKMKSLRVDKLLSALRVMAEYAARHGIGESETLDKDFTARVSQQMLIEEPISEHLEVSPEGVAKFNAYVLTCIDRETVEKYLQAIPGTKYQSKPLSARGVDYTKWSQSVVRYISSTAPNPNIDIFFAAGVKDFGIQRIIVRSLIQFGKQIREKH